MTQEVLNFERIRKAIRYIGENYKAQPSLEEVAGEVNLSPDHFQRIFTEWAGVSPKKFLQYISIEHAKRILKEREATLFDTALEVGLSGTGRLHDLFVSIEGMTPGEYKNGGEKLSIGYSFAESLFGELLVASTGKGICYMAFADERTVALAELKTLFPNASYREQPDDIQRQAVAFFQQDWQNPKSIKLHVKGTDFQLKVWEALLKIPMGKLATYGDIASRLNSPKACRAVGSAVGDNPVAFFIPCHRVILSTGLFGQYHWGRERKIALIGWENARTSTIATTTIP
ncbi:methylated-DNA--[protein]-cysteine S-methyltransferase [Parabacteroides sp. AM08-6]|uniref:bifunctional helix-turn-helix domain-containing protein/methylated-DNA--[protein]-cysteine S-methyltransferase n=1 Tax=Parabacteroides sp. AM08-6 TaxID=2292053 RepID=UPI000EFF9B0F|nr:methylated-DNA--[protein]-cysteine S-methyltransferase [Parabacteroides sp. AM08-6]RHJ80305.1 methylated-DNA--[protein]-cysteine S-methyltransferase [Parabacteroides sp. AM08-6]